MARLSKSHHFKIFQDSGIPTPPGDENDPFDDAVKSPRASTTSSNYEAPSKDDNDHTAYDPPSNANDDAEFAPRDSLASVSTFPESTSQQYHDPSYASPPVSPQKFFTPQIIRPSFRRPESVRRMQMSSPRQSILSYHRSSRSGTPRSEYGRESPRGRRRITEELTSEEEVDEGREHPLVLLHVTLLPIVLPWSMESMQELLPGKVLENLLLLRSKVSENVLQRGILIPHPREEYEMLEERLLEALELKAERLTKCGHFRGRASDSSQGSTGQDSDSGLGSGASSSDDGEFCGTCRHRVCCTAGKKSKWSVKIFAANGLMRSAAWVAAWSEMESVDVEILPWISEEDRRRLDRSREEEDRARREDEEDRVREMMMLVQPEREADDESREGSKDAAACQDHGVPVERSLDAIRHQPEPDSNVTTTHDLPPIYRASQVPLSMLLRNYLYLLAKDRRNVVMLFLGILAISLAIRSVPSRMDSALVSIESQTFDALPHPIGKEPAAEFEQHSKDIPAVLGDVMEQISDMLDDEGEALFEFEDRNEALSSEEAGAKIQPQQSPEDKEVPGAVE